MRKLMILAVLLLTATVAKAETIKFNSLNLSGDIVWDFRESELGVGAGTSLISLPDKVTSIRGELVAFYPDTVNVKNKAGLGIDVNVPALAKKLGATWIPDSINASIGILGLCDFVEKPELSAGIYLTVLKIGL